MLDMTPQLPQGRSCVATQGCAVPPIQGAEVARAASGFWLTTDRIPFGCGDAAL